MTTPIQEINDSARMEYLEAMKRKGPLYGGDNGDRFNFIMESIGRSETVRSYIDRKMAADGKVGP